MSLWYCPPPCRTSNRPQDDQCESCGSERPAQTSQPRGDADVPARCPFDGSMLHANGWCELGAGYPITRSCPFVCDQCREPLTWAGTCLHCTAYAPGDRYEYGDKEQHWRLIEKGPFVILPPQEQAIRAAEFAETMGKLVARMASRGLQPRGQTIPLEAMASRAEKANAALKAFRDHNAQQGVTS